MGAPSIKLKIMKNFWDKISLTDCKWSNLNAPGSDTPWCYSLLGIMVDSSNFLCVPVIVASRVEYEYPWTSRIRQPRMNNQMTVEDFGFFKVLAP